jgi:hypothetical protein
MQRLRPASLQPFEPMPLISRSMNDCKNNYGIRSDDVKDPIWKTSGKYATDVWMFSQE